MRMMYMKPTRHKHSSGFRTFECGYILRMENNRVVEKEVVTTGADHIYNGFTALYDPTASVTINMDITDDGYIRVWGAEHKPLEWPPMPLSSMEIMNAKAKETVTKSA